MCVFGCSATAEDSIEHYAHCQAVRLVACRYLRLGPPEQFGLEQFLLVDADGIDDSALTCRAVLVYATYMATNYYRLQGGTGVAIAAEAIEQQCKNAARGHKACSNALDSRWIDVEDDSGSQRRRPRRNYATGRATASAASTASATATTRPSTDTATRMVPGGVLVTGERWQHS